MTHDPQTLLPLHLPITCFTLQSPTQFCQSVSLRRPAGTLRYPVQPQSNRIDGQAQFPFGKNIEGAARKSNSLYNYITNTVTIPDPAVLPVMINHPPAPPTTLNLTLALMMSACAEIERHLRLASNE